MERPRKSVEDLAELYGISRGSLLKYQTGERAPYDESLVKMSEGLRTFARQLLFLREQIEKELQANGES